MNKGSPRRYAVRRTIAREANMAPTRRDLGRSVLAGTVALGGAGPLLSRQSLAEPTDQAAVDQAVEALRKAILDADEAKLRELVADELSYGLWPSGAIQNKSKFIDNIADKKMIYTSVTYSDPSIVIAANDAIVRHRESVEAHSDAKVWSVEFGVLQVWQKQDSQWKLLARQGWKA
jgi:hypothetical protein